jgi:hypothetical protein
LWYKKHIPTYGGKKGKSSAAGGTEKENHIKYCLSDDGTANLFVI